MKLSSMTWRIILTCAIAVLTVSAAVADSPQAASTDGGLLLVAQAKALPAPAAEPSRPMDLNVLSERVRALEKENLVLREDLGKARLDARNELNATAKRQAEQIEQLNQQVAKEHAAQKKRTRNLWYAIGGVALGALFVK